MHPAYSTKLGLHARKIDISAQKIDRSYLDNFEIVITDCSVKHKLGWVWFPQVTFMLANIGLDVVLEMLFLTFNKADIRLVERKLAWKTYTAAEALPTTKRVEIINKREFAVALLNADDKTFVLNMAALVELTTMLIHFSHQAQVAALTSEKTGIPAKYFNFSNVFSSDSAVELPEHTRIHDHLINLLDNKQTLYGLI